MRNHSFKIIITCSLLAVIVFVIILLPKGNDKEDLPSKKKKPKTLPTQTTKRIGMDNEALAPLQFFKLAEEESHKTADAGAKKDDSWIPERLKPIFDLNNEKHFKEKLAKVHSLRKNLSADERYALYYFIQTRPDDHETLVLKNDIMNAFRRQIPLPPEYAYVMVQLFRDKSLNLTNRMYILQHLRPWYEDNSADRKIVLPVLYEALNETESGMAGTALLALNSLRKEFPEIDQSRLGEAASGIVQAATQSILSRITAVQICAQMKISSAYPVIRELAQEDLPTALRISAIAALGDFGTIEDIKILEEITANDKKRYHSVARTAIKKIKSRI